MVLNFDCVVVEIICDVNGGDVYFVLDEDLFVGEIGSVFVVCYKGYFFFFYLVLYVFGFFIFYLS